MVTKFEMTNGSSTNDVTVLRKGGSQGFCDDSARAIVKKSITMGREGVNKLLKLRDAICGRPPNSKSFLS